MSPRLSNKGRIKGFFSLIFLLVIAMILDCQLRYPDTIILYEGETLVTKNATAFSLSVPAGTGGMLSETGELEEDSYSRALRVNQSGDYEMTLKLFGLVPVRSVTVDVQPKKELSVCGDTVGIKILSRGLVCVGTQQIKAKTGGYRDLAKEQDIRPGDVLYMADGQELTEIEELEKLIASGKGKIIRFSVKRKDEILEKELTPLLTQDGYRLGIWLRDSTAGIGTLTYYDPETLSYGALGHPITDTDTGTLMPVSDGSLLEAEVFDIDKGKKGEPGQLKGVFQSGKSALGTVSQNTEFGIYGTLFNGKETEHRYPVASRGQVEEGPAVIYVNLSKDKVEEFDIEIKRNMGYLGGRGKDMVIRVTDPDLLSRTGGIVQGMSGSPIVQNGKLVGAVTHVFVNDPTRGYGIFIENMLAEAEKIK